MKTKKLIPLMLVILMVSVSLSSCATARFGILSAEDSKEVKDTGTIERISMPFKISSKDIFLIDGDQGTIYQGRPFKKYLPLNLPEEFKKDSMRVDFTAKISIKGMNLNYFILILLRKNILPIEIVDIKEITPEEEFNLTFKIDVKQENKVGTPIPIIAKITNNGENTIKTSEMGLEINSLHLFIKTYDGKNLSFNESKLIKRLPEIVEIRPKETYSIKVDDITEKGLFVDEKLNDYIFDEGEYMVSGKYISIILSPISCKNMYSGELESEKHGFAIIADEPENIPPVSVLGGPYHGVVDEEITLDGSDSYDLDGEIVEYKWSYTNGASFPKVIGTDEVITHVFGEPGEYSIELQVTDDMGAIDSSSTIVKVIKKEEQEKAHIFGMVTVDIQKEFQSIIPIYNAKIVAVSKTELSEKHFETTTNLRGQYKLTLDPGVYVVTASKPGFESSSVELKIDSKEIKEINFKMKIKLSIFN